MLILGRNKTGILGWRSEKTEAVNGYEAKVHAALSRLDVSPLMTSVFLKVMTHSLLEHCGTFLVQMNSPQIQKCKSVGG